MRAVVILGKMLYFKRKPDGMRWYRQKEAMTKLIQYLTKQPRWILVTIGFLMVILVGIVDHLTGPEFFFSIFYIIPIFLVTWLTERRTGVVISIASAIAWFIADFTSGAIYTHPAAPCWNVGVGFGTFVILTFILSALKSAWEHEKELARTDSLTGTSNRRHFIELATMEINRARRYKHPFTVIHIDLDDFKIVNDRFGHTTGDALLRSVVNTIQNNVRATDIVARLGGDEFIILMPETGSGPAEIITSKIQKLNLSVMQKNGWPVTLSIGGVTFITAPATIDEMLRVSDGLMYAAKNSGKNAIKLEVVDK
jgi:diguanylate cyclase (GGDEF)-like protein